MTTAIAPKTARDFLALPEEPNWDEIGVCYWADEDAIISCVDANGAGWMLGRDGTGRWYRRRA